MIHFQRSLSLKAPSSSASCSFMFSSPSTSSALRRSMAKMQCRGFENYTINCLPVSPVLTLTKCQNYSQFKFRKSRVSCMIMSYGAKIGPNFSPLRTGGDGFRPAFRINPHLRPGALNVLGTANVMSGGVFGNGCKSSLSDSRVGDFSKRFLSQVPEVKSQVENVGTQDGRRPGNRKWFKMISNRKNLKKALATQSETEATVSNISKNADVKVANAKMVGSEKGAEELESSISNSPISKTKEVSKPKAKRRSKSKKTKDQDSAANAIAEVASTQSSESTSQTKKSARSKKGEKSSQDSELNATVTTPVEGAESSSTKPRRSKKGEKYSEKEKPINSAAKSPRKCVPQDMGKLKLHGKMTTKPLYPASGKTVVVVESVTKAKVIQGYLGDMFEVLPSYGHVRDLAARSGSVRPDDDFSMVWEVPSAAWTHLKSIKVSLNGAENLILASDPDREGEAIAWHIIEMLQQQDALHKDLNVARVVFHEITEASIKSALQAPREIDQNLVQAYLARRALDYLIGFNISPLLWRKLPSCHSAGRVQSAALALVCDREMEIDKFKPQEYWTIGVELNQKEPGSSVKSISLPAHLTHFNSKKLEQFSISSDSEAKDIEQQINSETFKVISSKKNKIRKNPPSPYITSTLQQDAANKLHFSASYTMKLAQKLYEGVQLSDGKAAGLITYTRTDGLHISDEAVRDIRSLVTERYGQNFASATPRKFFKKVKNAQEAHEAIRPTDVQRFPSLLRGILDEDSLKLYTLIWCRTVACQMESATIEQIQLDIGNPSKSIAFRSACSRVQFLGYQAVFQDAEAGAVKNKENEGNNRDEAFAILDSLKAGSPVHLGELELKQHHTQPPPRYSEASLVKKLEELGIGRPSTYASTIKVLQDRNYLTVKSRVLHPEFRGRMVSAFLCHHFSEVTDYSFTADMETELDNVSAGLTEWKGLLRDYWTRFSGYCERTSSVTIHQVEKMMEKKFGDFLFATLPDQSRTCPSCNEGTLIFKVSRFGAGYFIGCDTHPKCKYIAKTLYSNEEDDDETPKNEKVEAPKLLGLSPGSNEKVYLKSGPYGSYVQLGEDRKGYSPKRASIAHIKDASSVTVEVALELMRYPVTLGNHPTDGLPVILKISRSGYIVKHRRTMASLKKNQQPNKLTLEDALALLSGTNTRKIGRPKGKQKVEEGEAVEAM
ncbi:uncharacterized protein LOC126785323 [Argentina anserina]|uniref:uncharacterized protein LOC126785323 n=1 Tax=Argentina anserina TaxID=57926 RepID=UPI002176790D|nr:uncharacterized protein LOC126785323 [Potentilla anserina]XP_050366927.1 uncharacterized protein LOC126785323 [Potentilla anserina]